MAFERTGEGAGPLRRGTDTHHAEYRVARSGVVASGTFACPHCDAPVPPHVPVTPATLLICPFCLRSGRGRDFLSLAAPTRPARVHVRVIPR
jgi:hypothetical protein